MNQQSLWFLYLQGFFLSLVITLVLVPLIRRQAIKVGLYDIPDERKIHKFPIPRLGGVAMWLGFMGALGILAAFGWHAPVGHPLWGILTGGGIIFALGLADDIKNISPYFKLLVQILAALAAFYLGVQVNTLDLPGSQLLMLNALSLPVTVIWIVALANAMNFIDGVDGLASGVAMISAVTLAVVAMFTGQYTEALLASLLAGACLGFLAYNFNPAKIFMGDSGALFSGFMLAVISVTGVLKTKIVVMLLPLFVLSVPIIDITYAIFRRLIRGKNPFKPDASHIHHQLLKAGISQVRAVSYFYALCVVGGMIATGYVDYLFHYMGLLIGLFLLACLLVTLVRRLYPTEALSGSAEENSPNSIT